MNTLTLEDHPELCSLLQSMRDDGGVVITDHGRPVAVLQRPEVTGVEDVYGGDAIALLKIVLQSERSVAAKQGSSTSEVLARLRARVHDQSTSVAL